MYSALWGVLVEVVLGGGVVEQRRCSGCRFWEPQPGQDGLADATHGTCHNPRAWRSLGYIPQHPWPYTLDGMGCIEWQELHRDP